MMLLPLSFCHVSLANTALNFTGFQSLVSHGFLLPSQAFPCPSSAFAHPPFPPQTVPCLHTAAARLPPSRSPCLRDEVSLPSIADSSSPLLHAPLLLASQGPHPPSTLSFLTSPGSLLVAVSPHPVRTIHSPVLQNKQRRQNYRDRRRSVATRVQGRGRGRTGGTGHF